jgi:signal transduction histidine kinase
MGLAIAGMHYTGMAAARFAPGSICIAAGSGGIGSDDLAIAVGGIAVAILGVTIVLSTMNSHFAVRNARLAASLQLAKDAADAALNENERITAELREAQSELVGAARRAGMAEIATSVLHNVGNVLNSINVAADVIHERLRTSKVPGLCQAMELMNQHCADLAQFLTRDERGKRLLGYLNKVTAALIAERQSVTNELGVMKQSIDHVKDIVSTQQLYAGPVTLLEPVRIEELVEAALRMSESSESGREVTVVKDLESMPALLLDKNLLLQVLVNLIVNAQQAFEGAPGRQHAITIRTERLWNTDEPRFHPRPSSEASRGRSCRCSRIGASCWSMTHWQFTRTFAKFWHPRGGAISKIGGLTPRVRRSHRGRYVS